MHTIAIFSLLLIALVGYISAQTCPGAPRISGCIAPRDVGRRGRGCIQRNMWYYNSRTGQCHELIYLGCGGNQNRWCTREACQRTCPRR